MDKETIRRIVRRHLNEVKYCYEQQLVRQPSLAGRLVVKFTIDTNGRVLVAAVAESSLGSPTVEACVTAAVRRWEFPAQNGGIVVVSYPFTFAPSGGE